MGHNTCKSIGAVICVGKRCGTTKFTRLEFVNCSSETKHQMEANLGRFIKSIYENGIVFFCHPNALVDNN